jgi:dipeptidyl aminopeptidase/acylaminoacyl peptidase
MQPLVTDGQPGYAWSIDRVEWNIDRARWSPNSAKLAAFKVDTRHVDSFPIVDWLDVTEEIEWWPITRAGRPLERTELHVVDVRSKTAVHVPTGNDDHYLQTIDWTRDGSELLFLRMRRDYKTMDLMAANPNTGTARVVVSETQKTFVEGVQWRLLQPAWLPDGKRFVWSSERDGWNHLYLYHLDGTLIRRLTTGAWPVLDVIAVDPAGEWVYFTAHAEARVYDTHLYRVRLDGTGFTRLTEATGQHVINLSPSRRYFLDRHSSPTRPEATELRAVDGRLILTVATTNTKPLADLKWSPPEEFVVKAADGKTDLHGLLFKPHDFDPDRRYPVIDYILAAPNLVWVIKQFSTNRALEAQALAQAGFIVFMVDGRGTPDRGKAFQDVAYRQFGTYEIPDHAATLKQLARDRPYMDLQRVGLIGQQWPGSYMVIRGMLTAPDVYCAGVGRLVTLADPSDMLAVVVEPYLGLPQNDSVAYAAASNLPHISKLEGRLLLIAETNEYQAPLSDIMKTMTAFTRGGKRVDFILNTEREFPVPYRTYYMNAYRQYFQEHLLRDGSCQRARPGS